MNPIDILHEIRTVCENSIHTKTNGDLQYIEKLINRVLGPKGEYPPTDYQATQLTNVKNYNPVEHYRVLYGSNIQPAARTYLLNFIQQHPPQLVEYALNKAHENMADKPVNYANKLLISWKKQGYMTIEQVESEGVKEHGRNTASGQSHSRAEWDNLSI